MAGQMPMMQPQVVLLKEGTDSSQGRGQVISNINACTAVVDAVRSTLGPRGMDKLVHNSNGTTISNDGATIMKLLDIVHPAAKTLVDIAKSQDSEVGDGTTTVVLLAGEFLREAKPFVEEGVHPQNIIKAFRKACSLAVDRVNRLAITVSGKSDDEKRDLLKKCAETTLTSKLVGGERTFFAEMVVDAVQSLDQDLLDTKLIGMKKVTGGSMRDSFLVQGVSFKKTFSYAGFEQQPKSFKNPKILLLNVELELKSEKDNAEVRLDDPSQYQSIVDAEWNIIYDKLDKCINTGASIVLSRLAIGDLGTQYFADGGIFCAGRVSDEDMQRVAKATGGQVQTSVNDVPQSALGTCENFEERQVGGERFNLFTGCPKAKTATMVLRGGADKFIDEAERSLHDAIQIVRRALKNSSIVPGGGAIDLAVSRTLRDASRSVAGKQQIFMNAYAKAMEVIPRQLSDNAGYDATDLLNKLRQKHSLENDQGVNFGVDVNTGTIIDTYNSFVWEPALVKVNAITAATEAANMVLSVDETVRNPQSEGADQQKQAQKAGLGGFGGGHPGAPAKRGGRGGRGRGRGRGGR